MSLQTHGDQKYQNGALLSDAADFDLVRIEHRHVGAGSHAAVRPECTELVYILSGQAKVRRTGDGQKQEGLARPGTSWLVPVGTNETLLELDDATECLMIYLPDKLLDSSAVADFEIDPARARLAYAGGFADPTLAQITTAMHGLLHREPRFLDRIFADGLRTALAAHLLANYSADSWRPANAKAPTLDPRRLRRVLDFIAAHFADEISLDDLAREACLSPFHFSRLFQQATGRSPHRYLIEYRIAEAQKRLARGKVSMAEIAFDMGFGSQANFARAFRRITGLSPRQYRELRQR